MKKQNRISISALLLAGVFLMLASSCKKDDETPTPSSVADKDGNVYQTVTIGTQIWIVENLKTTRYQNGDIIGTTTPTDLNIDGAISPKYQWAYNGEENKVATYGRLYTWYAATDSRNVCPNGWHVPTDVEWTTLTTYLGGESIAGNKLKENGPAHWPLNETATNESGFTALPGGYRNNDGPFDYFETQGLWWSSTEGAPGRAWHRSINYGGSSVERDFHTMGDGRSVRCLKD